MQPSLAVRFIRNKIEKVLEQSDDLLLVKPVLPMSQHLILSVLTSHGFECAGPCHNRFSKQAEEKSILLNQVLDKYLYELSAQTTHIQE